MSRVGKQYAEALLELVSEHGEVNRAGVDLDSARDLWADPQMRRVLAHPGVPAGEKVQLVRSVMAADCDRTVLNLLDLLIRKGRTSLLADIAVEYRKLVDREIGVLHVEVHAPRQLEEADLEDMRKQMEEAWGRKVRLSATVDPDLIGGLAFRIGDMWLDGSLLSQLDRLRRQLGGTSVSALS